MMTKLTTLRAYNAVVKFFDSYWQKTKSDHLGDVLSGMQFFMGGGTADPATWGDWLNALGTKKDVTILEAYSAMIKFLDFYFSLYKPETIQKMNDTLQLAEQGEIIKSKELESYRDLKNLMLWLEEIRPSGDGIKPEVWQRWMKCVDEALQEPEGTREYLVFPKDRVGHFKATEENFDLLVDLIMSNKNFHGTDKYGNEWYSERLPNKKQLWAYLRGDFIDGGINETLRPFTE